MITFERFTKRFGALTAVEDLTLRIEAGEVVALLGPNGSGKTTSLKAAAGLLAPTSGSVTIGTHPASSSKAKVLTAYLPQKVSFPEALTGREVVTFYQRLRKVDASRVGDALRFASLNGASDRGVGGYSGGMVQRLGLAVSFLSDSQVMLLDEPTAALDPDGLCAFYALVGQRRSEGRCMMFTSHQLGDVEKLADRFAILTGGRLAAVMTRRELTDRLAQSGVMRLRVNGAARTVVDRLRTLSTEALISGDEVIVPGPASARPAILDEVRALGVSIHGLTAEEASLESLYRELVAR